MIYYTSADTPILSHAYEIAWYLILRFLMMFTLLAKYVLLVLSARIIGFI